MKLNMIHYHMQSYWRVQRFLSVMRERGHQVIETFNEAVEDCDCSVVAWVNAYMPGTAIPYKSSGKVAEPTFFVWHSLSMIKAYCPNMAAFGLDDGYVVTASPWWEQFNEIGGFGNKTAMVGDTYADEFVLGDRQEAIAMVKKRFGFDDRPIVAWFPSSSFDGGVFVGQWREVLDCLPFANVVTSLHIHSDGHSLPLEEHVGLIGPEEYKVPFLLAADLLISDISGAAFEWLILNKPLVTLTNIDWLCLPAHPRATQRANSPLVVTNIDHTYMSNEVFDAGEIVEQLDELANAVRNELKNPRKLETRRLYWKDKAINGFDDGRCSERLADFIEEVVGK